MISAVDSSVILDVVTNDTSFADVSEAALRKAAAEGQLVISECVLAEIYPAFRAPEVFDEFMADWQLDFVPSSLQSATKAGEHFADFLAHGGKGGRIVIDFLIGAHAVVQAERLVARDRGYLRDYFSDLHLLDPTDLSSPDDSADKPEKS